MAGAILTGLWAYAIFPLVDTGNFYLIVLAITIGLVFVGMMYGPRHFTELFSTEVDIQEQHLAINLGQFLEEHLRQPLLHSCGITMVFLGLCCYLFASLLTLFSVMALTETFKMF